jgi:hypothetical protein
MDKLKAVWAWVASHDSADWFVVGMVAGAVANHFVHLGLVK